MEAQWQAQHLSKASSNLKLIYNFFSSVKCSCLWLIGLSFLLHTLPLLPISPTFLLYFFFFQTGLIVDARLKELTPTMPVMFIKAIPVDKWDNRNLYQCPVYKTRQRGPTYVWTFNLKTKENPSKWTLAGVALLLQI